MLRLPVVLTLAAATLARTASAQPVDPYHPGPAAPAAPASPAAPAGSPAPADPAATPGDPYALPPSGAAAADPALAERIAAALVVRASELLDNEAYPDAKQLAQEALAQSPTGPSAARAREIIRAANAKLGLPDEPLPPPPKPVVVPAKPPIEDVDTSPIQDPTEGHAAHGPVAASPEGGQSNAKLAASIHGGLYLGLIGTTIGSFVTHDSPAEGAVPFGIGAAVVGGLVVPKLVDKFGLTEGQVRTIGSGTMWGGVIGGLFGDIYQLHGTTTQQVLVGSTIGSTALGAVATGYAMNNQLTRGDVALVDTLAGMGALGGLTIGMVMQPATHEAYSLNAALGVSAGVVVGLVAAPQTNTTQRRMLRVGGLALAGGAAPFLLYAGIHDPHSQVDERITGLLATAGLAGGAYLGFRLTDGMDDGLDTLDGKRHKQPDDAPVALVSRDSARHWGVGGVGIQPLSPVLAPQPGMSLQLVGAAW